MSSSRPTGESRLKKSTYQYPDNIGQEVAAGQHYMHIQSYDSINSLRKRPTAKSSIALYIPSGGLTSTIAQTYEEIEGGSLFATQGGNIVDTFLKAASGKGTDEQKREAQSAAVGSALQAAAGIGISRFVTGFKKNVIQRAGGGFLQAGMGLAINNHLAVGYKGPGGFREHSFAFKFFPKSKPESEVVKSIINEFQQGSTPSMMGEFDTKLMGKGSAFFKSPRHWTIDFYVGANINDYLHKITSSVITTMQVNYDPTTMMSFHKDGSPVQIDLNLTFKELALVTSKDVHPEMAALSKEIQGARQAKEDAKAAAGKNESGTPTGRTTGPK